MDTEKMAPRLLGAAYLIVIVTSLTSGTLLSNALGTGSISDKLANASANAGMLRVSNLIEMLTCAGVVALAVLLYTVLRDVNRLLATLALGLWLVEAMALPIARTGIYALIEVGQDFAHAGAPAQSQFQTLGDFLYAGIYKQAYTIHMLFYCAGGLLWYSMLFTSRLVPRAISGFGFAAVCVSLPGLMLQLLGYDVPMVLYVPLLPFELSVGLWLLFKGTREGAVAV